MVARTIFAEEHQQFRDTVRRFLEQEVVPHHMAWEEQGYVDREVWRKAGAAGFLCPTIPEEYGGFDADLRYSIVLFEEVDRVGASGIGWGMHSEIVAKYILNFGTELVKKSYLPRMASGEIITALGMTEPAAGSDLQGLKTTAIRDGDHYVLNGSKTFITNGWHADAVVVVAKTDPAARGSRGTSLFVIDTTMPGFTKGRRLKKVGLKAQDTCELFFDNVRIPATHLLGKENEGFIYMMKELPWERMQIAVKAMAACEAALQWTVDYTRERKAFGQTIFDFQNTKFKLAELKTEIQIGRIFVDKLIELLLDHKLDATTAAMAKYWCTDLRCKVMDTCLQLHGGYGYMWEYPIGRAWADARIEPIYGGTNEIMKELISRTL
ncbi:MAG: acyl-CoA dehydrogenase family protein [Proteobacteria bacterium]|nr:acyl-CoA dehydrogenase family protein [Pseudomonadota bacterium]HQR02909.1 acyl-CoA dehydrogenase family protein [Rhodocyclaceae bacterium]